MRNVLDYGAKGDGVTLDTAAIQRAIDAGGMVHVPPGVYLTGTLYLKSHGGLDLEAGATLLASTRREDYNADDFCPQNEVFTSEEVTGAHLIVAVEQEQVFIKGEGTIDGNGRFWMNEEHPNKWNKAYAANPERPGQMVYFCQCRDVTVSGVHLQNGPYWHLFFHGCEDVMASGLTIRGDKMRWTNDGIDIDCCRKVMVSDCLIEVGDDALTLRANGRALKNHPGVTEYVTVSNCILSGYIDYGIRVGVGQGTIRCCTLNNIIIHDSYRGLGMTCRFSPTRADGTIIEDMQFSNMQIYARRPIELRLSAGSDHPPVSARTHIRGIRFSGIHAEGNETSMLLGYPEGALSDISFRDVELVFGESGRYCHPYDEHVIWELKEHPAPLEICDAADISFDRLSVRWQDEGDARPHDVVTRRTKGVTFTNCALRKGVWEE